MYLESKLGMSPWTIEESGSRGTDQGGKMKSTIGWNSPNTGANNSSGFTGLPGGYRYNFGPYTNIGGSGGWWSSSEYDSTNAWYRGLGSSGSNVVRSFSLKRYGFSVRCVRD